MERISSFNTLVCEAEKCLERMCCKESSPPHPGFATCRDGGDEMCSDGKRKRENFETHECDVIKPAKCSVDECCEDAPTCKAAEVGLMHVKFLQVQGSMMRLRSRKSTVPPAVCEGRKGSTKGSDIWCLCNIKEQKTIVKQANCENLGGGKGKLCKWDAQTNQ